ncbi:unnamed protein product [Adineta ricciae]|uniref:Uncharacterized protein n=1 Tax=Adineta ricciae TaxID=249248 RepID=A0A814YBF7_ADIRI|nr:unnamed protein product [Adineta ricciae]CAF1226953.1 unnamed protein product [Adineta ricciae]
MKDKKIVLLVLFALSNLSVHGAQDPIELKVSAAKRGLLLGSITLVKHLRFNVDKGQYISNLVNNYDVVVPDVEMKPGHIWRPRNIYNFTDVDWLLGATPDTMG